MQAFLTAAITLLAVAPAAFGQLPGATAEQLRRRVPVGEIVLVTDATGQETWGDVERITDDALIVRVMEPRAGSGFVKTVQRRSIPLPSLREVFQSNTDRAKRHQLYPPSWHRVEELPEGATLIVRRADGSPQRGGLIGVSAESVRFATASGEIVAVPKREILSISRRGGDSTINGTLTGAAIGSGVTLGLLSVAFAACDDNCEAPSYGLVALGSLLWGGGIGAGVGWLADKLHQAETVVFPASPPRSPAARRDERDARGIQRPARSLFIGIRF